MTEIVIWAQSVCRSTMALYREVKRLPDIRVTVILRQNPCGEQARQLRELQGQGDFSDVVDMVWDGNVESGRKLLGENRIHVFSGYQVSENVRRLMREAKSRGCRVVEYDEAPCEMCLGVKAVLKRLYYRFVLPWKVRESVNMADVFISASGQMGMDRLMRLGWRRERIVPFGYASPTLIKENSRQGRTCGRAGDGALRVLHLGGEAPYRGVSVAERAVMNLDGIDFVKTGGELSLSDLVGEIRRADIVVACGLCEPWGMRVNDVLLEGVPVVVSDGMGAAMLCDQYGCGCVVPKGDVKALSAMLIRCKNDHEFLSKLKSGAVTASRRITPENKAKDWLEIVIGK